MVSTSRLNSSSLLLIRHFFADFDVSFKLIHQNARLELILRSRLLVFLFHLLRLSQVDRT